MLERWGEPEPMPAPRPVRHGRWRLDLCGHYLDRVAFGGVTLARRIYGAVRDEQWRTVPGAATGVAVAEEVARTRVSLYVDHGRFRWTGTLTLTARTLTLELDGHATEDFDRTRIGLCVLHPLLLAGTPVRIDHPGGTASPGKFPEPVSPWQPLTNVHALRYRQRDLRVTVTFTGDTFETEDQRNWSDASYKTYSTPLALPVPVPVRAGDRVRQRVRIQVAGTATTPVQAATPEQLDVGEIDVGELAAALPAIGLPPAAADLRPAYLHGIVDLADPAWRQAVPAGGPLVLTSICPPDGTGLAELVRLAGDRLATLLVFDRGSPRTSRRLAAAARAVLPAGIRLGGGSRAHFAELNRTEDLPHDLLDLVTFPIAAQTHDTDRACVRESLQTHPLLVRQARRRAAGKPLLVGPVGFQPAYPPEPAGHRAGSVFGAAWTLAALAGLGYAGAESVCLGEVPAGSPVRAVLELVAGFRTGRLHRIRVPEGVTGLAVRDRDQTWVMLAYLGDTARRVQVGELTGPWRVLAAGTPRVREAAESAPCGALTLPAPSVAIWQGRR